MLRGTRQSIWEFDAIQDNATLGRLVIENNQLYLEVDGNYLILSPNHEIKVIIGDTYEYVTVNYNQVLNVISDMGVPLFAGKKAIIKGLDSVSAPSKPKHY